MPSTGPSGATYVAFWGERRELLAGDTVTVEPRGVQALVLDDPVSARRAVAHFQALSARADDEIVSTLGGHGELVSSPRELRPALERALAAGRPALVNVLTDPAVAYPRRANLA